MELSNELSNELEECENSKDIEKIKLYCLYVDKAHNLENITTTEIFLNTKNELSKPELKYLIQINDFFYDKKFKLISILKHNVDSRSNHIIDSDSSNFLEKHTEINNIKFNKSNDIFQDLNSLYFLYFEDEKPKKSLITTRKLSNNIYSKTKKQLVK